MTNTVEYNSEKSKMNKLEYTTQNKMLPNLLTVLQPKAPRLLAIFGLLNYL